MDHASQKELRNGLLDFLSQGDADFRDARIAPQPEGAPKLLSPWDVSRFLFEAPPSPLLMTAK